MMDSDLRDVFFVLISPENYLKKYTIKAMHFRTIALHLNCGAARPGTATSVGEVFLTHYQSFFQKIMLPLTFFFLNGLINAPFFEGMFQVVRSQFSLISSKIIHADQTDFYFG
jgi:hypothetical protein